MSKKKKYAVFLAVKFANGIQKRDVGQAHGKEDTENSAQNLLKIILVYGKITKTFQLNRKEQNRRNPMTQS